jgi:hypothetical protein
MHDCAATQQQQQQHLQQHRRSLPSTMTRAQLAAERDDIQKRIASALLVMAEPHAPIKAPIIVLQVRRSHAHTAVV